MQRQPDALQPDDEHEVQTAACQGGQEAGDVTGAEHADFEQIQPEHGLRHMLLDEDKCHQRQRAADQAGEHKGIAPAHAGIAVRLDAIGDADQHGGQAEGEKKIAGDVEMLVFADGGCLVQGQVGPDGAAD